LRWTLAAPMASVIGDGDSEETASDKA
jgi:hypothetical protein